MDQLLRASITRAALVSSLIVFSAEGSANAAVYDCTTVPYVVDSSTGNRTMVATDILRTSSNATCIELRDGRDLDMNGATVECTDGGCGNAIRAFSAGSVLRDGTITGAFANGVDDAEVVLNMTIDGPDVAINSTSFTRTVRGNVIRNAITGVITNPNVTSTSSVDNNFIESGRGTPSSGIATCGSSTGSGPSIENNFVREVEIGISTEDCQPGSDYVRVTANILADISSDNIANFGGNPTLSDNLCSDSTDCPAPTAPFVLP